MYELIIVLFIWVMLVLVVFISIILVYGDSEGVIIEFFLVVFVMVLGKVYVGIEQYLLDIVLYNSYVLCLVGLVGFDRYLVNILVG